MTQNDFEVNGRHFESRAEYTRALRDKASIDKIKQTTNMQNKAALERLNRDLQNGKYHFYTLLGKDFREEVEELLKKSRMETYVREELKKQEKRRKLVIVLCSLGAVICLGYVGIYSWFNQRTSNSYEELSNLKEKPVSASKAPVPTPQYTLDKEQDEKEVLEEYKNLLNKNKKLIGWIKIDDTNIDYPVMQTSDNEYYLDHNLNQEYDKNGSIFMDKGCDVLKPSTNFIIYGHHMRSGQMFGNLDDYEKESYYKDHPYIQFDTIYEKGLYQVMYVFRSRVYREDEIVFKYYQFIDANGEQEFSSYMKEMAEMSLYDTGVTAEYGDRLLTLSTCDYQETNGRFVVVAKRIEEDR